MIIKKNKNKKTKALERQRSIMEAFLGTQSTKC